jgi:hypothetical protein
VQFKFNPDLLPRIEPMVDNGLDAGQWVEAVAVCRLMGGGYTPNPSHPPMTTTRIVLRGYLQL